MAFEMTEEGDDPTSPRKRSTILSHFSISCLRGSKSSTKLSSAESSTKENSNTKKKSTVSCCDKPSVVGNLELSGDEKRLLKLTWSDDFMDLFDLGTEIYYRIFKSAPLVQNLFQYVSKDPDSMEEIMEVPGTSKLCLKLDNLKSNKEFRSQSLKFVQTLSRAVCNYTVGGARALEFDAYLENLGEWHRKLIDCGFRTEFWDVFRKVLAEIMKDRIEGSFTCMSKPLTLSEGERKCAVDTWEKLSNHVIAKMKIGFFG